jgi:hypothetical protein
MARPKGSMNRNSKFLLNRLQDMYGEQFDPVMKMAQQAVKLDELAESEPSVSNQKESIQAWGKIAEFVSPKLKAVEMTGDTGITLNVTRKRFDGSNGLQNDNTEADE